MEKNLRQAVKWLGKHTKRATPVVITDINGLTWLCAYIYRIERLDKPNLWFCVDSTYDGNIKRIRRICVPNRPS